VLVLRNSEEDLPQSYQEHRECTEISANQDVANCIQTIIVKGKDKKQSKVGDILSKLDQLGPLIQPQPTA
jgi:hypothetical protein